MRSRIALVGAFFLSCSAAIVAQQPSALEAYTDEDAYQVYDALLPQGLSGPTVVIEAETRARLSVKNSHSMGAEECIDPGVAPEFKDAISEYNRLNQNKWLLQRKFSVNRPYEIIDAATLSALAGDGGWKGFSQRFPESRGAFRCRPWASTKTRLAPSCTSDRSAAPCAGAGVSSSSRKLTARGKKFPA